MTPGRPPVPPVRAAVGPRMVAAAVLLSVIAVPIAARAAPADEVPGNATFALIIGVNKSVDPDLPVLRYADDDAARYQELFRALGGRTYLLTRPDENTRRVSPQAVAEARDPRRAELDQAVAAMAADVARARARGVQTLFYFIYAGHGTVTGSAGYLSLEDARLTAADIEHAIVDRVHADQSHLIVDACSSYFLAQGRGPSGERRRGVGPLAPPEGLSHRDDVGLLLSTSSARESHEWAAFEAGVFSHEIRSGLFGAADFDGDGQVSYREIAAFVRQANAAIPGERFRPRIIARPPHGEAQLLDLRKGGHRRLRVGVSVDAEHYLLEDARGVRLADFHNARGHALSLLLPVGSGLLYLRRASDEREMEIPPAPEEVQLAELSSHEPRSVPRGPADKAFNLIFSLPFDDAALAAYEAEDARIAVASQALAHGGPPAWRTAAGRGALVLGGVSLGAAVWLTFSARSLAAQAAAATNQQDAAAMNARLTTRNREMAAAYAVGVAAAVGGSLLLLWSSTDDGVRPYGEFDGEMALAGIGGRF